MRNTILLPAVVALLVASPLAHSAAAQKADRPNVVIILTDDQGYGDFSCHGNPVLKTPYLDKLHDQSIRFVDFHVCPMCTPTRGQIMTGRDALANGAMNVSSGRTLLRRGVPTMADIFAASGYRTGHFGKWHLGDNTPYRPFERGFQESIYCKSWGVGSAPDYWNNDYFDDFFWEKGVAKQYPGYCTDVWFAEATRFIKDSKKGGQPFFVYLPLNAAHGPLFVPDKYREPYRKLPHPQASFFGMIANIDENIAKFDDMLKAEGLLDNTIVIFMTDNGGTAGTSIYNAGMRGRKTEFYEGGHRVPCFFRWPGEKLRAAGDVPDLAECQDLLPTLIDLCGLKKPEKATFDGTSWAAFLRGEQQQLPDRTLVVQYSRIPSPRPKKGEAAVMWRRWRLVGGTELYDLTSDPAQERNVADKHADIVSKLQAEYDKFWSRVEKNLDEFGRITVGSDAENPVGLSPSDWQDVHCDQSAQARRGEKKSGPWGLMVDRGGEYEILLRRWPKEANLALTAGVPPYKGVDGELPGGPALPITKARVRIGEVDVTKPAEKDATAVAFTVRLKAGPAQLQTWFYNAAGEELCGAFYTEVVRK